MVSAWKNHLASKGAPVIVGEWGTSNVDASTTDYDARRPLMLQFAEYFVKRCKANGIATFYWMGLSDGSPRSVPEFNQADLKDAIIKGYYGEGGYTAVQSVSATASQPPLTYDLQGRRVATPRRGLYIKDGKKYVSYQ